MQTGNSLVLLPEEFDEIDAYYERMREASKERRHRRYLKNKAKEDKKNCFLVILASLLLMCVCFLFVALSEESVMAQKRINVLERQYEELKLNNLDALKRIETSFDYKKVKKMALDFGMGYPKQENIIYYNVDDNDYMLQLRDIPSS